MSIAVSDLRRRTLFLLIMSAVAVAMVCLAAIEAAPARASFLLLAAPIAVCGSLVALLVLSTHAELHDLAVGGLALISSVLLALLATSYGFAVQDEITRSRSSGVVEPGVISIERLSGEEVWVTPLFVMVLALALPLVVVRWYVLRTRVTAMPTVRPPRPLIYSYNALVAVACVWLVLLVIGERVLNRHPAYFTPARLGLIVMLACSGLALSSRPLLRSTGQTCTGFGLGISGALLGQLWQILLADDASEESLVLRGELNIYAVFVLLFVIATIGIALVQILSYRRYEKEAQADETANRPGADEVPPEGDDWVADRGQGDRRTTAPGAATSTEAASGSRRLPRVVVGAPPRSSEARTGLPDTVTREAAKTDAAEADVASHPPAGTEFRGARRAAIATEGEKALDRPGPATTNLTPTSTDSEPTTGGDSASDTAEATAQATTNPTCTGIGTALGRGSAAERSAEATASSASASDPAASQPDEGVESAASIDNAARPPSGQ